MKRDSHDRIDQLFKDVAAEGFSRRQLVRRAAALGISMPALSVAMVQMSAKAAAQGAENPLGVDPNAPLDIVIFKGGYGDDYAINVRDQLYQTQYPNAQITYAGTQRLQEQYQARLVDGNPPDVMDNSGAGNFNSTTLYTEGQLADLSDLMQAPAYGQEGVTFADSLRPGTQVDGVFDGKQVVLKYVYSVYGIWFNQVYMDQQGYTYPTTWDEMLQLCAEIKGGGIAPWTYQGQSPQYMRFVFDQLVYKAAGFEAIMALDNLEENSWTSDGAKQAMTALRALYDGGYIMEGTAALTHTDAQAQWLQGKAVFLPCGSWLSNEMKGLIPEGFQMTVQASPSLTTEDTLPQTAIQAAPTEDFIVFSQGKNIQGGKEYLRLLFSQEAAAFFAENVQSLTSVAGVGEGVDLGTAFNAALAADQAAGDDKFVARYAAWYADLNDESKNQFSLLMTGQASVDEVAQALQDLANQIRDDDSIPKFTREAPATPVATPATPAATPATPAS